MSSSVQFLFYCLFLTVYHLSQRLLCVSSDTMVRHGKCIEDVLEAVSPHQFNASSVLDPQSEQFQPYQSQLKSILEDDVSLLSQAWCPMDAQRESYKEWLEIRLPQLYLITNIMTKGRRQGNTQAFVSAYRVRYQREEDGLWFTYTSFEGSEIIQGNADGFNHVRRTLDSPIVAKRVRIYPEVSRYPSRMVKLCLKLKLFGCPFEDGVVEYRGPIGFVGKLTPNGDTLRMVDQSYDNSSLSQCIASIPHIGKNPSCPSRWTGGMGILMDNKIYSPGDFSKSILERGSTNFFVGWRQTNPRQRISLALRFYQIHTIHEIRFYMLNLPSRDVAPFESVHLHTTVTDICSNFTQLRELDIPRRVMSQTPDRLARLTWISIPLRAITQETKSLIGRYLCIDLVPQSDLMLLGEIRVNATPIFITPAEENFLKDKESGIQPQQTEIRIATTPQAPLPYQDVSSRNHPSVRDPSSGSNTKDFSFTNSSPYSFYMLIALIVLTILLFITLIGSFICALVRYKRFRRHCVACLQYPRRWTFRTCWSEPRSKKQINRTSLSPTNSACYSGRCGSDGLFQTNGMRHSNTVGSGGFNYNGAPQWIDYKPSATNAASYPYNVASLSRLSTGTAEESHRSLTPLASDFYPQQHPGYNLPPPQMTSVMPTSYPIPSFHLPDSGRRYFLPTSQHVMNAAAAVPLLSSSSMATSAYPLQPFYVTYATKGSSSQMPLIESCYSNPSQTYDHTLSSRINRLSMASSVSMSGNDAQGTASTNTSLLVNSECAPPSTHRTKTPSPPTNSTSASLEGYSSPEREDIKKDREEVHLRPPNKNAKYAANTSARGSSIDNQMLKSGDRSSFILQERQPVGPPLPPNHPSSNNMPGPIHYPHPDSLQYHRFHPFIFHGVQPQEQYGP